MLSPDFQAATPADPKEIGAVSLEISSAAKVPHWVGAFVTTTISFLTNLAHTLPMSTAMACEN